MATTETDSHGRFQLNGKTTELTTIDVQLRIFHECDDGKYFRLLLVLILSLFLMIKSSLVLVLLSYTPPIPFSLFTAMPKFPTPKIL
jgi:hypothetical protein